MTCVELQESLTEIEHGCNPAQRAHLKTCPECSALVRELNLIISAASQLSEADEPSPRVWNSIEFALRKEGIIRPQRPSGSVLPSVAHWGWARWFVPIAAMTLFTVAIYLRPHHAQQIATNLTPSVVTGDVTDFGASLNDDDLMQEISQQTPALKAQYTDNLRHVNQYIADEKGAVDADPNDEEARRSLMEAYQEKAMLFE
jgi:hypothetical protein